MNPLAVRAVSWSVLVACAVPAAAQRRVPLDGTWQIRPESAAADAWRAIAVPSAFETALGVAFDGIARYRLDLPLPATRVRAVRIEFAAVATHARVFVNDRLVGEHLGGWTPFRVDATDALRWDGHDALEVVVDERVGHNTQGFLPIIQPHFGGIWQSVTLCLDDGPVIDRLASTSFGAWRTIAFGNPPATLDLRVPVLGAGAGPLQVTAELRDGDTVLGTAQVPVQGGVATATLDANARPWSPADPKCYTLRCRLTGEPPGGDLDQFERNVAFRTLAADGTSVTWNGAPLQLRGVLHWGYSPPFLAPPSDAGHWRPQLAYFKSLGFNCLKCCLWVPPPCVYDLCDELGLLVWQEYPTWHPQLDQAHKQELLTEYGEFFQRDRSHASVAFRSITCETGHSADLDVVKALYDACKAAVPDTLVVDDSSWIGWQRVTDFWDEHPYGNNSWWPGRLADFQAHIRDKGAKPLLLGECLAADTWVDLRAFRAAHGDTGTWWRPLCWNAQRDAERWLVREFGDATLASLEPLARAFGMRNRKFQIERLRLTIPDAGYVVSVARDFAKARMGLFDDLDRPKWSAAEWAWHGDTMLCLDVPGPRHALAPGDAVRVRVAHAGATALAGTLQLAFTLPQAALDMAIAGDVALAPGAISEPHELTVPVHPSAATRVRVTATLTGSHPAQNTWDLWLLPPPPPAAPDVLEVDALTPELLDRLLAGARVLLRAGDRAGSVRTEDMWFLKGAPFAPPHPLHDRLPRELLLELSSFDLESGRVVPWRGWRDQVDPMLAFWETHDIDDVRFHLLAFDTRVGEGRLVVTALAHDGAPGTAGPIVLQVLRDHVAHGPPPRRALTPATITALRQKLTERRVDLVTWRFRTDPDDLGRGAGLHASDVDTAPAPWRDLRAGSHWENQAEDLRHYTGIAWYRTTVDVPADWQDRDARIVFEGVDDSFEFWLDGEPLGAFGDPATGKTVWLEREVVELGKRFRPGRHTLALRVVDHAGAGGLWKPVFVTTGPTDADAGSLLR